MHDWEIVQCGYTYVNKDIELLIVPNEVGVANLALRMRVTPFFNRGRSRRAQEHPAKDRPRLEAAVRA